MNNATDTPYPDFTADRETSAMNLQRLEGDAPSRPSSSPTRFGASKLTRMFGRDANNPEEILILNLKLHLDKLQRERQYKNAQLAARNALLIERDEEAEFEYRRTHKSEEELLQEWIEETKRMHEVDRMAFERDEEAPIRAMIAEEEQLERQFTTHSRNLSLGSFTVERMVERCKREERAKMEEEQKYRTLQDAFNRSAKLLFGSWTDGFNVIEREEKAGRRNIVGRFPHELNDAKRLTDERQKGEAEATAKRKIEENVKREEKLDQEVDDLEAQFAARMEKLRTKFEKKQ